MKTSQKHTFWKSWKNCGEILDGSGILDFGQEGLRTEGFAQVKKKPPKKRMKGRKSGKMREKVGGKKKNPG